jgi:hypothetical protein
MYVTTVSTTNRPLRLHENEPRPCFRHRVYRSFRLCQRGKCFNVSRTRPLVSIPKEHPVPILNVPDFGKTAFDECACECTLPLVHNRVHQRPVAEAWLTWTVLMIVPVRVFMTVSEVSDHLPLEVSSSSLSTAARIKLERLRGHRDFERLREWQQSIPLLQTRLHENRTHLELWHSLLIHWDTWFIKRSRSSLQHPGTRRASCPQQLHCVEMGTAGLCRSLPFVD